MSRKIFAVLLLFLLFLGTAHATFTNPKSVEAVTVKLTQSGIITVPSYVKSMNLTLYIPQEGVQSIDVYPDTWSYTQDALGNKQVFIQWKDVSGVLKYSVESVVANSAEHLPAEKGVGNDPRFLKETPQVVFDDDMRKIAYPYEKTLENAVALSVWVNDYMIYDTSYAGKRLSSDRVLSEKRGVCVEYANLLASLLRVSGIPARYITGYAYSSIDKKFIGHTWVEVIAADGSGIGIDPTWDEAGYIDATHIKTGELLDDNQTEVLMFAGDGNVDWKRNDEEFQILDYKESIPVELSVSGGNFAPSGYGFVKANVSDGCILSEVSASSCIDNDNRVMMKIYDDDRKVWSCGAKEIYWFFQPSGRNYICPVNIYDQTGARASTDVNIEDYGTSGNLFITGTDSVGVNDNFQLESSVDNDFVFYSPTLEEKNDGKVWTLNIKRPGTYKFYLYSNGGLATKEVNVLEKNDFSLNMTAPKNASLGSGFLVTVDVTNLQPGWENGRLEVTFEDNTIQQEFAVAPTSEYSTVFNLTARNTGMRKISVSALGNGIATYSSQIYVYESRRGGIIEAIAEFFANIGKAIGDFFAGLFK